LPFGGDPFGGGFRHAAPGRPWYGAQSLVSLYTGILSTARQPNVRLVAGMRCLPTIFYGMMMVLLAR